jgi:hypothetical protein
MASKYPITRTRCSVSDLPRSDAEQGDGGPGPVANSPEVLLETLSAQASDVAMFPGAVRAEYFFAYDMLLDQATIARFVKGMQLAKIACLTHHRLVWPYYSPPVGSALPSILRTNLEEDCVWGVLYNARGKDLSALNTYLRVPNRYHRRNVITTDRGGRRFPAFAFILSVHDDAPGKPSRAYLDRLLSAAVERELPEEWLEKLRQQEVAAEQQSGAQ